MRPLKVASLFTGAGGADLGLQQAGHTIIMQAECEEAANKVGTEWDTSRPARRPTIQPRRVRPGGSGWWWIRHATKNGAARCVRSEGPPSMLAQVAQTCTNCSLVGAGGPGPPEKRRPN